jgi:hypothetical protein
MQGPIAQVISLTAHGNAYLSGVSSNDFYPGNSTFRFCEYVRFVDFAEGETPEERPYADNPLSWFERLKQEGAQTVRMHHVPTEGQQEGKETVPERRLVGFIGGGGRRLLEVTKRNGSDFWEGRWEAGDEGREDQRVWRVTYGRIATDYPSIDSPSTDLASLEGSLSENLHAIATFARSHKLDGFAEAFEKGLAQLISVDPLAGLYHNDLAPTGTLPLPALQLLAAAQSAWVFGGMGSWNDMAFEGEDQSTYDRLSEDLYQVLNDAIVASANHGARAAAAAKPRPWWKLWN